MRLDTSKPYGMIYGHEKARFEQEGKLFSATGLSLDEPQPKAPLVELEETLGAENKFTKDAVKDFLVALLPAGEEIERATVMREADINNLDWDAVKTMFVELRGKSVKRKNVLFWSLPA
jgi:hypothetical protein